MQARIDVPLYSQIIPISKSHFISNSLPIQNKRNFPYITAKASNNNESLVLPTMSDILEASRAQKLNLELQTLGPFFRITAKSLETERELGKAEGLIRVWLGDRILHLDSIRLQKHWAWRNQYLDLVSSLELWLSDMDMIVDAKQLSYWLSTILIFTILSPKRYRRDNEKEDRDDRKQLRHSNSNQQQQQQQPPPLLNNKDPDRSDRDPPKHSAYTTQPPRSRSNYQHDERASTGHAVGRSAGRREAEGKVFTQNREHTERKETGQGRELRDEKSQAKLDDKIQRRDGFPERKDDPPTTRKRPAFREKKIPVDSGDANPAAKDAVKSSHAADHPPERNDRKEERSSNPRHLDRSERQVAEDRAPNRNEARRDGFSSRVRYGDSGGNSNYRARDKFNGRQGYHPIKTRTEKWKHDLYQEVNKDPIPKTEDDQIAKLEALLAS